MQRFISEDPIGFASGDYNFYRYVGDDPVDLVDPWGAESHLLDGLKHFGEGVKSVGIGLYNFGDYLARVSGFRDWQEGSVLGNFYQEEAIAETKYTCQMTKLIIEKPIASHLFISAAKQYILNNKAYVAGRLLTRGLLSKFSKAPFVIPSTAAYGDVLSHAHEINIFARHLILGY